MRSRRSWVVLLLAVSGGAAASQQPAPARGAASISGVVFDSLVRNAPLAGAEVTIDGTQYATSTNTRGQFRFDGIPAGRATLRFYHASLDSLGFGAAPTVVTVPDSGTVQARLSTPSPARLHARLCPGPQPPSSGVVLGRVRNVDDGVPLQGATATANWSEWSIGTSGMVRADRRSTAAANDGGAFALCGVPNDVPVVVRAAAAGHVTGLVDVDLARRLFVVRDFGVSVADSGSSAGELSRQDSALARGDSIRTTGASMVSGVIRGGDGRIVDQAQVAVFGFPISTRTGSQGTYALRGLPAGTQTVAIRAVGYAPKRITLDVRTGEHRDLDITLEAAQELAPVNIVGRGTSMDRTGYESRRKAGIGRFITEEEIRRRGVFDTEQVLSNVLGARVIWNGSENVVRFTRPSGSGRSGGTFSTLCAPAYWVDGVPMPRPVPGFPEDVNTFVKPRDIRGIEVYTSPSQAPAQYRQPDVECGVVMIWTKAPRPKQLTQPSR